MGFPDVPRTVLITGCSSGIGRAAAVMLKNRGWTVYATARNPEDLEGLHAEGLTPVEMDVASADSLAAGFKEVVRACDGRLGALVNNAGFGQGGAVEDLERDALRYQFEVNVFGAQDLVRLAVPLFRAQGAGRIVNISSVVGRVALPFMGAYSSTKFALEALSDVLRVELDRTGIAVSLVEPGPIITAFRENALDKIAENPPPAASRFGELFRREMDRRRNSVKRPGFINKPPEAVGQKIIHAIESPRPRRRYCVTPPAYAGAFLSRFAPDALLDAVFVRRLRKRTP